MIYEDLSTSEARVESGLFFVGDDLCYRSGDLWLRIEEHPRTGEPYSLTPIPEPRDPRPAVENPNPDPADEEAERIHRSQVRALIETFERARGRAVGAIRPAPGRPGGLAFA